jgi:hypothetical protein
MQKTIILTIRYCVILLITLVLVSGLQSYLYSFGGDNWQENNLPWNYITNFVVSLFLGFIYIRVFIHKNEIVGYAFLASISIKFILFFVFVYPQVRQDGQISRVEFLDFFIPFATCLLIEVGFVIRLLKR